MAKQYSYDIREFQLHCAKVLDALDKVCHEHGITYYIIDGTLLGAVRHNGFIPWDDDIDIALLRKDYDALLEHADEWFPKEYHIVTPDNNPQYPKYFAKIEDTTTTLVENFNLGYMGGIYVDIFPLDSVPASKTLQRIHYHKFHIWRRLQYLAFRNPYKHGHGVGAHMMALFQKLLSKKRINDAMQRILVEYNDGKPYEYVMTHDEGLCALPVSALGTPKKYLFEGKEYDGPCDADVILSSYYGKDYMQLPPIEKRKSHFHDYCDFNRGYKECDLETLKRTI